jgi:hypothetical protein
MPSRQQSQLCWVGIRDAGTLKVVRPASGRQVQVLALAELVNLCEGRPVI